VKIRSKLVSNSSSSSFIGLLRKKDFDEILEELDPYIQMVMEKISTTEPMLGIEVTRIQTYGDEGDVFEHLKFSYDGLIPEDELGYELSPEEAFERFLNKVPNNKMWFTMYDGLFSSVTPLTAFLNNKN
jgi:hypothetical protein